MSHLEITKLRSSVRKYFDQVEKGKSYVIVKKGKPIAKVIPFHEVKIKKAQGWKREIKPVTLRSGIDSSLFLREERDAR